MRPDLAVLGAGPVGIVAALSASRRGLSVVLSGSPPAQTRRARLELVPAQFLHVLLELDVRPQDAGWATTCAYRRIAWEAATPSEQTGASMAVMRRFELEEALLNRAARDGRITFISHVEPPTRTESGWKGRGWEAPRLLDATGRSATTAMSVVRWPMVAWHWLAPGSGEPWFGLAAVPEGYVYRCAIPGADCLGLVQRGSGARTREELRADILHAGVEWILEGFDWSSANESPPVAAGVQWTAPQFDDSCLAIGDARLARDPLSSQGLLSGVVDALGSLDAWDESPGWAPLLRKRQDDNIDHHRRSLLSYIASCRFRDEPHWRGYSAWLETPANAPRSRHPRTDSAITRRAGRR